MKWASKYIKSFSMGIEEAMQYRSNFLLGLLSAVFPITIQIYIWNAVFMNDREKLVYGFTYEQLIIYTLLSAVVTKFISTGGFEWEVNDDIKNGGLNKFLMKPIGYFEYKICCTLGKKVPQSSIIFLLIIGVLVLSGVVFGQSIDVLRIAVFVISIVLAAILNIMISYCISVVAFWISEAGSFFLILNLVIIVISGGVFPLEIFGDKINFIFNLLPFKYTVYFPVTIINGKLDQNYLALIPALQILWILVMSQIAKILWKAGLKTYTAIGG